MFGVSTVYFCATRLARFAHSLAAPGPASDHCVGPLGPRGRLLFICRVCIGNQCAFGERCALLALAFAGDSRVFGRLHVGTDDHGIRYGEPIGTGKPLNAVDK